jgi:hypothetical protein
VTWGAEAAAEIHAAYAEDEPVRYTGAGLTNEPLAAVKYDVPAEAFQGPGNTLRQVTFEILQAALPQDPAKGNMIVENDGSGQGWRVNDITRRDDVFAWHLVVEKTA